MKIAVFGTGMVGQALAGKLCELGHEVTVGTRDVEATVARTEPGPLVEAAGEDNLSGKVLIDIANPLDFSQGRPPSFSSPTPTRSASRSSVTSPRPRS